MASRRKENVDVVFNIQQGGFNTLINTFSEISDTFKEMEQGLLGFSKSAGQGVRELDKAFVGLYEVRESLADHKGLTKAFEHQSKIVDNLKGELGGVRDLAEKLHKATGKEAAALEKNLREKVNFINKQVKVTGENLKKQSENLRKVFISDREDLNKYLTKEMPATVGRGIGQSIQSAISSGDLQGVISGVMTSGTGLARGGIERMMQARRERRAAREAAGMAAGGRGGMGRVVGALGRLTAVLGPMVAAMGGVALLVKMLIDSEAQTKNLNKSLLETVSLYRLGEGNLAESTKRMEELRASATSFRTNLRLGIDPEQHYEVIKALNDHNASLEQLARNYQSWGQMATEVVTDVRLASLNLGVSMSEVAGFMGRMQSIHSMALPQIRDGLNQITDAAAKSGMSTQKFFNAIAQLGDQMSLYNYRLDRTVGLMRDFSQLMDPEAAQAFVNTLVTGFKDKTPGDRLREMAIAFEGNFQQIAEALQKSVVLGVRAVSQEHTEVLQAALGGIGVDTGGGSPEELARAMSRLNEGQRDALFTGLSSALDKRTASHLMMLVDDSRRAFSGDTLSNIDAARNLGPVQQFGLMLQKLEKARRDSGMSSIEDVTAIVAEKYGIDEKELEMVRRSVRDIRSELRAEGGPTDLESIMARMAEKSEEQLADLGWKEAEQRNFAEEQVAATTSVANILKYLIYDVLNRISGVTSGIYRWVAKRWGSDRAKREAVLDERFDRARGRLESLKREQEMTRDPAKAEALSAQIAAAEASLQREAEQKRIFEQYRNQIYGDDGSIKRPELARQVEKYANARTLYGYTGSYDEYAKLERETAPYEFHGALEDAGKLQKKEQEYSLALQEEIQKGNTSSKHLADTFDKIAASDGMRLTSESYKKMRDAFIEARVWEETRDTLESYGLSRANAEGIARGIQHGIDPSVYVGNENLTAKEKEALGRFITAREVPSAGDAKIMTSGVAALRFKAGDMVVDRESLAQTVRGRPGEFIPDFMRAVAAGASRGGGGGGINVHNTFNIHGGNTQEIENTILRVMDMVERVRNGER